jgi:hypothetical protein
MSKKQNDASKIAGMASILKSSNREKELPSTAPRSKSGRIGKYRDPSYHQYGIYLRKETHKRVKRRLEDTDSPQDVSDLAQELFEKWLASGK